MVKISGKSVIIMAMLCMLSDGCQNRSEKKEEQEFLSKMQFSEEADKKLSMVGLDEIKIDERDGLQAFVAGDQVTIDGVSSALNLQPSSADDHDSTVNSIIRSPASTPATFKETCQGSGFATKCAGQTVHGIGYISLALPGQDYRVVSGEDEFQLRLPNGAQPIKLNWFDKVEFSGLLQTIDGDRKSSRPIITDATLAMTGAQGTAEAVRLGKVIKLFAICNEKAMQKVSRQYIDNAEDYLAGKNLRDVKISQAAINKSRSSTGVVLSRDGDNVYNGACWIDNGEIKASYVKGSIMTPFSVKDKYKKYWESDYKVWIDRAAREKEFEEYEIASEKERLKKQAEFAALSEHNKFKLASASIEASLEAIGSFIPTKPEAQSYIEMCNYDLRPAIDNYKRTGLASSMQTAQKNCSRKASMLCIPARDNAACDRFSKASDVSWN